MLEYLDNSGSLDNHFCSRLMNSVERNWVIERFIRTLKEECVWVHRLESLEKAEAAITRWIDFYNNERPHSALNYIAPMVVRRKGLIKARIVT